MAGRGQKKFAILVALELIISSVYNVVLFQHQTQQYKQNLTKHWQFMGQQGKGEPSLFLTLSHTYSHSNICIFASAMSAYF